VANAIVKRRTLHDRDQQRQRRRKGQENKEGERDDAAELPAPQQDGGEAAG